MARTHKYVKRTGTPGNYKYWYKMPDGSLKASDDPAAHAHGISHEKAKHEHLKRLIAAMAHGKHTMTPQDIAAEVGVDVGKVNIARTNMRTAGERAHRTRGHANPRELSGADRIKAAHDFEEHHLKEATFSHPDALTGAARIDYHRHVNAAHGAGATETPAETPATPRSRSRSRAAAPATSVSPGGLEPGDRDALRRAGFRDHPGGGFHRHVTHGGHRITKVGSGWELEVNHDRRGNSQNGPFGSLAGAIEASQHIETRHDQETDREAAPVAEPAAAPAAAEPAHPADAHMPPGIPENKKQAFREAWAALHAKGHEVTTARPASTAPDEARTPVSLTDMARRLSDDVAAERTRRRDANEQARREAGSTRGYPTRTPAESAERARAAAAPASPAHEAVAAATPGFAEADAPVARMIESQARGENPYLNRAKDIYNRISADLKEERKKVCQFALGALEESRIHGTDFLTNYKRISGNNRATLASVGKEFESGTFMSLEEVLANRPVDPEVERMKHGYAAKQFARLKPYLKASWTAANPGAPPPMPTYGDIKSWADHEREGHGPKPAWAGTTRLALPKEVHDAAAKGADGKPKHPPEWMPIHLAPAWNYIVKKSGSEGNPYQTVNPIRQGRVATSNQAGYQEGIAINVLRKYVQMRGDAGGAHQLVDIPSHKLAEVGLAHTDIFKADKPKKLTGKLSDEELKEIIRTKVIDPVALVHFYDNDYVDDDADDTEKSMVRKSIQFVISADARPVEFKKSFVLDLKKAEKLQKIQAELARRRTYGQRA